MRLGSAKKVVTKAEDADADADDHDGPENAKQSELLTLIQKEPSPKAQIKTKDIK